MLVCDLRRTFLIGHGKNQTMGGHFEQICEDPVHISLRKVFKHMKCRHGIKCSQRTEIIGEKIALNVPNVPEMAFGGKFLCYLENTSIDVKANCLTHKRDAFGEE